MTERTYAFDGVQALIAQLEQRGLPWGVVTNKSARFTDPLTRAMPLFAIGGRGDQRRHHAACQTASRAPVRGGAPHRHCA